VQGRGGWGRPIWHGAPTLVLCLLTAAVGLLSCRGAAPVATVVSPGANIVLVSIDTLRADHLSCYGYPRRTSPNIDGLASRSFVFERAYAQSHNTLVSHATLLTSLNPISHGATPRRPIDAGILTLAEALEPRGYRRAAFTTHPPWLSRKMGFAQGFGRFRARDASAAELNGEVFAWLRTIRARRTEGDDRPFFLFVHYYDVHSDWDERPYETRTHYDRKFLGEYDGGFQGCRAGACASVLLSRVAGRPDLLSPEELEWVKALYDGGIAYTDHQVGGLLQQLRDLDLLDSSWIVVTSDHGEEFREHGRMLHSQPYEETARVPLVIRPPGGVAPRRFGDLVGLVDLAPTLLEGVGLRAPAAFEGRSLVPLMELKEPPSPPIFWVALGEPSDDRRPNRIAVRRGTHTLVASEAFARLELYEHDTDPTQREDVASERPGISGELRDLAARFYEEQLERGRARDAGTATPSEEEIEKLRALGYLGS